MELSGLIFVALAVVWAVVLIPKALKHHDDAARHRAVDNVSEDARVLARREAVSDREARLVVQRPSVPAPRTESPVLPTIPSPRKPMDRSRLVAAHRAAAASAARRRRWVLAVLLLSTLAVAVGSLTGVLQPWAPAVPAAVVLGFLVLARVMVRKEHARFAQALAASSAQSRRVPEAEATSVEVVSAEPADIPEAVIEVVEERNDQGMPVVSGLDDTASFPVGLLADPIPATRELWDPVPVTLPTYVTKPRATRSVRTIDLNAPGVASSGRNAADSALVAEAATAAAQDGDDQRAVGS